MANIQIDDDLHKELRLEADNLKEKLGLPKLSFNDFLAMILKEHKDSKNSKKS